MIRSNYTNIKRREKRLYSIFNTTISKKGLVMSTVWTCVMVMIPFNIFGILFCIFTDYYWYNPVMILEKPKEVTAFLSIVIILPIVIGTSLNKYKVQNIRLLDYLAMLLTPKLPKTSNGKVIKETGYKIDTMIEKIN